MRISALRISDDNPELSAGTGKTRAFFSQTYPAIVSVATINELVEYAANIGGDVRLCLHKDPSFRHHDMIIVQRSDRFVFPHRHPVGMGETWNILRGEMAVFVFDDSGAVIDARRLTPDTEFLYRAGDSQFHLLMTLSLFAVYHESKPGPFEGPSDNMVAPWMPDVNNAAAIADYRNSLLSLI